MAKITISFSLDDTADKDVLRWLDSRPERTRSGAIRDAIRATIERNRVSIADVYQVVCDLERKLQVGVTIAAPASEQEEALRVPLSMS